MTATVPTPPPTLTSSSSDARNAHNADDLSVKFVYDFHEGSREAKDLLGGKGANLAEMANLQLPVPPGFTLTTHACRYYLREGHEPPGLREEVSAHLADLERRMGKTLGQADDPLLVSVRSGAAYSMPGMMETVLNVGLTDASVHGLAAAAGDERFAWDSYRRLLQMFGKTVLGVDGEHYTQALEAAKAARGVELDTDLDTDALVDLVGQFQQITQEHSGRPFPQDPREQLDLAIRAVFESWNAPRAVVYRRAEGIPADLGTAVSVVAMVFGNLGETSGTGVAFTRDPSTGARGVYGDYLPNAQGEDVVAGIRNTVALAELERLDPGAYGELREAMDRLEAHYRDLCDIEFTIERGHLWMLQVRVGKRTAAAAFRIAVALVDEGVIDIDEALRRVSGAQLTQLMFPHFDAGASRELLTSAIAASPGAAVGELVFTAADAVAAAKEGRDVILVRRETNPDDLDGMIAARGVLTSRGGKTSHAAVVARGLGKTCVCGAEALDVDAAARTITVRRADGERVVLREGDLVSIDGATGEVFVGEVPVAPSPVVDSLEGRLSLDDPAPEDPTPDNPTPEGSDAGELVRAVHRLLRHADERRVMGVRANADTAEDAARAVRFGAEGIGLCRTEHMFLGARRVLVERLVLADDDAARQAVLAELLPVQRDDFVELLTAMGDRPVTVRLLDPPLHEFLPDLTDLTAKVAVAEATGHVDDADVRLLHAVQALHERNPMLGLRGVRLGIVTPGLFAMQVRTLLEAAAVRVRAGARPRVEIMVPLVGSVRELQLVREDLRQVAQQVADEQHLALDALVGTMIELPRAAVTAGRIAEAADFFSFGTNDLTQTVWGFSRDDVEGGFFSTYLDKDVLAVSPFESLDVEGVGALVRAAAEAGRATRPDLKLGVCGEHGGDPRSVHFFHEVGLDYVSCSPFRVPVARLEAGRAAVGGGA